MCKRDIYQKHRMKTIGYPVRGVGQDENTLTVPIRTEL